MRGPTLRPDKLSPSIRLKTPVAGRHRHVVEKSVFGILLSTRQLWAQLLSGESPASSECAPALDPSLSCTATDSVASVSSNATSTNTGKTQDTISATEAQAFISSVLQPCINLMRTNTARELMTQALACVRAWLQVIFYSSLPHIVDHCNVQGEDISSSIHKNDLVAPLHLTDAHRQQFPPAKFLPALARLTQAHEELEESTDWLQPKGVGVVCIKDGGIKAGSFVHFYFGKMYGVLFNFKTNSRRVIRLPRYSPSKWFEREAAIEVIKVRCFLRSPTSISHRSLEPSAGNQKPAGRLLQYGAGSAGFAAWRILPSVPLPFTPV